MGTEARVHSTPIPTLPLPLKGREPAYSVTGHSVTRCSVGHWSLSHSVTRHFVTCSLFTLVFPSYAELHCLTNFSFFRGASHPEELVERAAQLRYSALAITDECSVAGVVRAHGAAKESGLKIIVGAEFEFRSSLDEKPAGLNDA